MRFLITLIGVVFICNCGPAGPNTGYIPTNGGGERDGGEGDAGRDAAGGGDTSRGDAGNNTSLTQANCNSAMDMLAAAGCSDSSYWTQMKNHACTRLSTNLTTTHCQTPLQRAQSSYPDIQGGDFYCNGGSTDSTSVAAVDVLLGVLCAATVNNNDCAGVTCQYNSDCPSEYSCNDATERCYQNSASFCAGLPCIYNSDCPDNLTCNDGTGQCNLN